MLSFTLVSNWKPAELPPGDTRNTEATASKNMEQLAPLGPMFQGKMGNSNIKKNKICNFSVTYSSTNTSRSHRGVL